MRSDSPARRLLAATLTVALASTWTLRANADCKNDSECKGDRVCEKGVCVSPSAAPPPPVSTPTAPPPSAPAPAPAPPSKPAAQPTPFVVDVTLTNGNGEVVTFDGAHARETCRAPCSVQLPPGRYFVKTKGLAEEVDIPSRATELAMKRACTTCYVVGGIALGLGIGFTVAGTVMRDNAKDPCLYYVNSGYKPSDCTESGIFDPTRTAVTNDDDYSAGTAVFATGIALAVTGAVAIVAGIVIGGSGVTIKGDKPSGDKPSDATTPAPANGPRFGVVGRGVGITF